MYSFYDLQDKIKNYFRFSGEEAKAVLITVLSVAFILSFQMWGDKAFDLYTGLRNFGNVFLIVALSILVKLSVQKIYSLHIGYKLEYKMWFWGVFFAVILCFASNGWLYLIPIGGFIVSMIPGHRLGYFRYDINYFSVGIIALIGPLANICLALFFKLFMFLPNPLIYQAMRINVLIAFFSMLPFPPLDGSKVLFAARPLYAFGFFGIAATGLLLMFMKSVPMAIILGLIFAILGWAFYFFSYEFK